MYSLTITDSSIEKITKYKWIDAGGGKYDLEVTLKLKMAPANSGGGGIVSSSKKDLRGLGINRSVGVGQLDYILKDNKDFIIESIYNYKKGNKPWGSTSFLLLS